MYTGVHAKENKAEEDTMDENKIKRINELYRRSKAEGLTEEEKKEQQLLRREYIEAVKANLRGQLNNISIQETDGSITDLGEKFGKKRGNSKKGSLSSGSDVKRGVGSKDQKYHQKGDQPSSVFTGRGDLLLYGFPRGSGDSQDH